MKDTLLKFITEYKNLLLILIFTLIFFTVTIFDSKYDVINPDSINWHQRSYNFIDAIKKGNLSDTYQAYHPGITLMWLLGPNLYLDGEFHNKDNFLEKDFSAKIVLFTTLSILFALILYLFSKFVNTYSLVLFATVFILEPFFLGVRRLVHLESLLTFCIFVSFLFLIYYLFKNSKFYNLFFAVLFWVLAFYTKSSAVVILPVFFLALILGNLSFKKKLQSVFLSIFFIIVCLYLLFPALWKDPIFNSKRFFTNIYEGATLIGYEGRREVGTSGQGANRILDKSYSKKDGFYETTVLYTSSPELIVLVTFTIVLLIYFLIKHCKKYKILLFSIILRIFLLALASILIYFFSYSYSTKSFERYIIVIFPFILLCISLIFNYASRYLSVLVTLLYLCFIAFELINIHPYYYSYGNTYLGGSYARYEKLNSPPFGVATYEISLFLSNYIKENEIEYFPVIGGMKSLKAIFKEGRNENSIICDVDYLVYFYRDKPLEEVCPGRTYIKLTSIKVGNIDYWSIYRFSKRASKAKLLNTIELKNIVEEPDISEKE